MFTPGTQVKTTEEYFKRHGRVVYGTVVPLLCDVPDYYVAVKWDKQEGNVDHRMHDLKVLMKNTDIKVVETN